MAAEGWRGQEQAQLLLAALDHKPAAPRMVELLESPRGEVMVAAAWGLRKLAVPDTLAAMLDKAGRQTDFRLTAAGVISPHLDHQVAHLFETMGIMKYAPAEPLLRRYVPKDFMYGMESRPSAIWALGLLHAGTPDEPLAQQFMERLTDPSTSPPEQDRVRVASAISLGRMKAVSQVPAIKRYMGPRVHPLASSVAMQWAIRELTGEQLPDAEPLINSRGNFFLEPLDVRTEELVPVER
jgi:HEAT repeat protein